MSTELARREPTVVESMLQQIIAMPAQDGLDRVAMLERIVALKERTDEQDRRNQFAAAMSALQAELPQIDKRGKIFERDSQTKVRSTYARIEDLDSQIRPYLAKHGFSFSFDTQPGVNPGEIRGEGTMTHCAGHSEKKYIDMPIDTGGAKSKVQERSSTLSVIIRNLLRMHLNLIMRDVDDDGQGKIELITAKDLATVKSLIAEKGADPVKFLAWLKVEKFEDIPTREVTRALAFLRAKEKKAE